MFEPGEARRLEYGFPTVFGRGLIAELNNFVHQPFLVATMEDLWELFGGELDPAICRPYLVRSMEERDLLADLEAMPDCEAVVGLGGGQALDAAKFVAWKRRLPMFTVPTALSVNAAYGQRFAVRNDGVVRYMGWAVPEAVYIDYDVIRAAPRQLNYSGIGDVLCFHTGVADWRYAHEQGVCEAKWPYDPELAAQSLEKVEAVLDNCGDIRDLTDRGIDVLVDGLKWGTSFHGAGWNPRQIEGVEHYLFYALEISTGVKFLHGQPVCLGVVAGSMLHGHRAEEMLDAIHAIGLDIRPSAMGITWEQVTESLLGLREFAWASRHLWRSIAHDVSISPAFCAELRERVEDRYASA